MYRSIVDFIETHVRQNRTDWDVKYRDYTYGKLINISYCVEALPNNVHYIMFQCNLRPNNIMITRYNYGDADHVINLTNVTYQDNITADTYCWDGIVMIDSIILPYSDPELYDKITEFMNICGDKAV